MNPRAAIGAALDALVVDKGERFGQLVHLPGHAITLTPEEENLWYEMADVLHTAALDPLRLSAIAERLRMPEDQILTVGQFREATSISRHATMPVLGFFDRVGFTRRHQDGRRIRVEPETIFGTT